MLTRGVVFREEMGALWKCFGDKHVCLGWIRAWDGITLPQWEVVCTPGQLPIHRTDIFFLRDNYVRALKATFGMYEDPAQHQAGVKYEEHVTTAIATQESTPRSKFTS